MYRGSMNGGGSGTSSGVDRMGNPSLFSFGFYSTTAKLLTWQHCRARQG